TTTQTATTTAAAEATATAAEATTAATLHTTADTAAATTVLATAGQGLCVNRQHKIGYRINLHHQFLLGVFFGRDDQNFVLNDIRQLQVLQHQSQRGTQRDVVQVNVHRCIGADAGLFQRLLVELDRNAVFIRHLLHDVLQRLIGIIETVL